MPKTKFLQIRVNSEDLQRIRRVAHAEHLEASTWARQVLLKAVEKWEALDRKRLKTGKAKA